jgi:hypothetical protein
MAIRLKTAPDWLRRLLLFALIFLVLNFGIDPALFPWHYGLPGTLSAEGRWKSQVPLETGETIEVIMDLYHEVSRFTKPGALEGLNGDLEICVNGERTEFGGVLIAAQPAMDWKGHNFVLAFREGVESQAWPWNFVCEHSSEKQGEELLCKLGDSGKSITMQKVRGAETLTCGTNAK